MNIPGYIIGQEIGQGGMAKVYLAIQESLQRQVALKIMVPVLAADPNFSERFLKEARIVAQLSHPHILAVHDIGSVGHLNYIAMEYVDGGDLKQKIRQGISSDESLRIVKLIAEALSHAHEKGFIHRDIKPENILFRSDGSPVLTDFGISKAVRSSTRLTATGMSIGTPHYISPEQARGRVVDARSDLYSLGVVLFEMLTGEVPYNAEDTFAIAYSHINDPIPRLPEKLSQYQPLVDCLMAKQASDRFNTTSELIQAIEDFESAKNPAPPPSATRVMPIERKDTTKSAKSGVSRGLKWALGGVALAILIGITVLMFKDTVLSPAISHNGGPIVQHQDGTSPQKNKPPTSSTNPLEQALSPSSKPPAGREESQSVVALGAFGSLSVSSEPPGADVYVDGSPKGKTPLNLEEIPAGNYRLEVKLAYHMVNAKTLVVEKDTETKEYILLTRGQGSISVSTTPPGAEIVLDGNPQKEKSPLTISSVEAGPHTLVARLSGYQQKQVELELQHGQEEKQDLMLEPIPQPVKKRPTLYKSGAHRCFGSDNEYQTSLSKRY